MVEYYYEDPPKREPCVLNDVGLPIRPVSIQTSYNTFNIIDYQKPLWYHKKSINIFLYLSPSVSEIGKEGMLELPKARSL